MNDFDLIFDGPVDRLLLALFRSFYPRHLDLIFGPGIPSGRPGQSSVAAVDGLEVGGRRKRTGRVAQAVAAGCSAAVSRRVI